MAEKNGMLFFEASAKKGDNVSHAFVSMARKLMEKRKAKRQRRRNKDLGTSQLDMETSFVDDKDGILIKVKYKNR